jgi:hypothetical protein
MMGNINVVKGSITGLDLVKIFRGDDYEFHEAAIASISKIMIDN